MELTDEGGLRASTTVDGEPIRIETRVVSEPLVAEDGAPYNDRSIVAVIAGAEETPYAELRLGVTSDEVTGELTGWSFGEALAGQAVARVDRDWVGLASSRAGDVFTAVSARARVGDRSGAVARGRAAARRGGSGRVAPPGDADGGRRARVPVCDKQCTCTGDETDENCPEDCGCAPVEECGGVAPFGCYCSDDCAENGDCCVDACMTCGAGCPACDEGVLPCDDFCADVSNVCDGESQCSSGADEARCGEGLLPAGAALVRRQRLHRVLPVLQRHGRLQRRRRRALHLRLLRADLSCGHRRDGDDRADIDEAEVARVLAARVVSGDDQVAGGNAATGGHRRPPHRPSPGSGPRRPRPPASPGGSGRRAAGRRATRRTGRRPPRRCGGRRRLGRGGEQPLPVAQGRRHAAAGHGDDRPGAAQPDDNRGERGDRPGDRDERDHASASAAPAAKRSS